MASSGPPFDFTSTDHLLICTACGTQFDETSLTKLESCRICDDPRQFVPKDGQSFTTLGDLKATEDYLNKSVLLPHCDDRFISIWTEPKFAIGQRCVLIKTPRGNVLWDCITYLDEGTIQWIKRIGGLQAIIISHPHYYTTHLLWARVFGCPVYLSREDGEWLCRAETVGAEVRALVEETVVEVKGRDGLDTGVRGLKLGGHFPGSLVCLYEDRLLVADTLVTTPSGLGDWKEKPRPKGMNSFAFMWSIPNMIPLPPDELARMWSVLKKFEFKSTHGAFVGTDIVADDIKQRVLESMKIQVRNEGYTNHALLEEA